MVNLDRLEREALARGLGFTPVELSQNQAGRLSARQRISLLVLAAGRFGNLCVSVAPAALIVALLACLAFVGWKLSAIAPVPGRQRVTFRALSRYGLLLGGYLAALGALVYYCAGWLGRGAEAGARLAALLQDLAMGRVECQHGRMRLKRDRLCIGEREFRVPPGAVNELAAQDGLAWYTVYFTPHSLQVVSAEPGPPTQNV